MTVEEALKNIEAALASVQANLSIHQALQKSLQVVKDALGANGPKATGPVTMTARQ